ncbi:MAG: pitrilysin family protein [Candidatus Wallbacteria bacterium]
MKLKLRGLALALLIVAFLAGSLAAAEHKLVSDTLPNGMKVYVLEDHNSPLVAVQIWVRTGGVNETYKTRGMSHFLEHLLFKGTKKRKVGELDRELDAIGASNNAATYYDYTFFQATGASCYFDKMLDVEVDGVLNSTLEPEEVEKERKVVIEEIKMNEDKPQRVLFSQIHRAMFDNLAYSYPVIGFQKIIETVPRDVIYNYYKEKYNPNNMIVVIVGDIKPEVAFAKVKEAFRGIVSNTPGNEKIDGALEEEIIKPRYRKVMMDIEKTYSSIAYRAPELASDDIAAMEVLTNILGEGASSKLNVSVKEKQKLVDVVAAAMWNFRSSGLFFVYMMLDPKNVETAKDAVFKEIAAIKKGEITSGEIEKAKNSIETAFILNHQNYENMAEYIGQTILLSSEDNFGKYLENIKKVTKEDIVKVANKYLTDNGYVFAVVEPNPKKAEAKAAKKMESGKVEKK